MAKTKAKAVPFLFIAPTSEVGLMLYGWLLELLEAHHQAVQDARFALVWATGWKPDDDGRLILGQCKRCSDLDREIFDGAGAYDFVILLNQNFWDDPLVTDLQRRALLDHELYHAGVKTDDNGAPIIDDRGRVTYRLRKHDLEEFSQIAERYGCWKRDLEVFAKALATARGAGDWIGFQRLHDALLAAGAPVPLHTIYGWNESERREAAVWAKTFREVRGGILEHSCPAYVLEGISRPSDASQRPS